MKASLTINLIFNKYIYIYIIYPVIFPGFLVSCDMMNSNDAGILCLSISDVLAFPISKYSKFESKTIKLKLNSSSIMFPLKFKYFNPNEFEINKGKDSRFVNDKSSEMRFWNVAMFWLILIKLLNDIINPFSSGKLLPFKQLGHTFKALWLKFNPSKFFQCNSSGRDEM